MGGLMTAPSVRPEVVGPYINHIITTMITTIIMIIITTIIQVASYDKHALRLSHVDHTVEGSTRRPVDLLGDSSSPSYTSSLPLPSVPPCIRRQRVPPDAVAIHALTIHRLTTLTNLIIIPIITTTISSSSSIVGVVSLPPPTAPPHATE